MKTRAIWDDDRDAGGEKIYELGVKDLEESMKVIELSTWLRWDWEGGNTVECARSPPERRTVGHSYSFQCEARLQKAGKKSNSNLIQEGRKAYIQF